MARTTDEISGWQSALHVGGLWALAVAWPIYDILRHSPEFFVAYRTSRSDILWFVLSISFAAPFVLWSLVRIAARASPPIERIARIAMVGLFSGIVGAQALQTLSPPAALHVAMAAGFGFVGAALYSYPAVRSFATWLGMAIPIVPLMFLSSDSMRSLVWPTRAAATLASGPRSTTTPIVVVVFDQFPLTSILEADGSIDARSYPGFAELAARSTWYRNATTSAELTSWALPSIVSGQYADAERLPTASDYPDNLFTALGRDYQMEVFEPLTRLCPDSVCPPGPGARNAPTLVPMLEDAAVVLAHRVIPHELAADLPPVDESWKGFAEAQGFEQAWAEERQSDRRRSLNNFLEQIDSANAGNTLYFLHALLPHEPYEYLPSGQLSGKYRRLPGITFGRWTTEEWPVAQAYARELLQVRLVDGFVQRLLARLREQRLFDRALLVITSDHGVSFTPGSAMKAIDAATAGGILPVPLFVKRPGQSAGEIDDRNVQSVDVLPLMADLLGAALPFATDGRSPIGGGPPLATKTVVHSSGRSQRTFEVEDLLAARSEAVARRVRWFGNGPAPYWTPMIAPARALLGRSIDDLGTERDPSLRITVDVAEDLTEVDPAGDWLPALLSGRARGAATRSGPIVLAIAVNGRIEATTETYHDLGDQLDGTWSALVDPTRYRRGFNDVRVFAVRGASTVPRLVEGFRTVAP